MALGKATMQSTTYGYAGSQSSSAVDGNKDSNLNDHSCATTDTGDVNPWWAVDLGQLTNVQRVVVTNRGDGWRM